MAGGYDPRRKFTTKYLGYSWSLVTTANYCYFVSNGIFEMSSEMSTYADGVDTPKDRSGDISGELPRAGLRVVEKKLLGSMIPCKNHQYCL